MNLAFVAWIGWTVVAILFVVLLRLSFPVAKAAWDKLQAAPATVVARVRAGIMILGGSGLAFPHQTAEYLGWPWLEQPLKVVAVLCLGISLVLRAGDKTPEEVKAVARGLTPAFGIPVPKCSRCGKIPGAHSDEDHPWTA